MRKLPQNIWEAANLNTFTTDKGHYYYQGSINIGPYNKLMDASDYVIIPVINFQKISLCLLMRNFPKFRGEKPNFFRVGEI